MSNPWDSMTPKQREEAATDLPYKQLINHTDAHNILIDNYLHAPKPMPTGLPKLDEALGGGWFPGENILAGEPGAGKTALAVQTLVNNAVKGRQTVYWSLEMPASTIIMRSMSYLSSSVKELGAFFWSHPRESSLDDTLREWGRSEWGVYDKAMTQKDVENDLEIRKQEFASLDEEQLWKWVYDDAETGAPSYLLQYHDKVATAYRYWQQHVLPCMPVADEEHDIDRICDVMDALHDREGIKPLTVIDYLQYCEIERDKGSDNPTEYERVSYATHQLSKCAKRNRVPIIAISSMNKVTGDEPTMDNLRSSGNIKFDAESIVFLCIDRDAQGQRNDMTPIKVIIKKNRYGKSNPEPVLLWFDGRYNIFYER